jgi:hypothetical protein
LFGSFIIFDSKSSNISSSSSSFIYFFPSFHLFLFQKGDTVS